MSTAAMKEEGSNAEDRLLLVGCGILRKEVLHLIRKNNWPVEAVFFDSALHCELDRLSQSLTSSLEKHKGRKIFVFYGSCHPLMEKMLSEGKTFRTEGQNCVDILLGTELFTKELTAGAFFLMEEWAKRWRQILIKTFGTENLDIIREIFRGDRQYLLCLRTPCSGDFTAEAEEAGRIVDLPLRWMDIGLDHLEAVLEKAVARGLTET
ncbi:MAG: DUF1638 domain-containing protein [Nitrospirales bacterium]|nr:DUF1638 domain-containing protein [Nitrospirales bacterium]